MNREFFDIVEFKIAEYSRDCDEEVKAASSDGIVVPPEASGDVLRRKRRDEKLKDTDLWTEERKQAAEEELSAQGAGVSEHWRKHYVDRAGQFWHEFYKRNSDKFYKDRHYLHEEFPELLTCSTLLEVGCGVGNAVVPLYELHPKITVYAVDFAKSAIEILQKHPIHANFPGQLLVSQCDVVNDDLPTRENQCDLVLCLFVLSAMSPENMPRAVKKLYTTLRPGGKILVRDYGQYDQAQMRFKKGSKLSDSFYVRQDSTCSYFFSLEFLDSLLCAAGFHALPERCENICKVQENRAQGICRHPVWVQAVYEK